MAKENLEIKPSQRGSRSINTLLLQKPTENGCFPGWRFLQRVRNRKFYQATREIVTLLFHLVTPEFGTYNTSLSVRKSVFLPLYVRLCFDCLDVFPQEETNTKEYLSKSKKEQS